jgi:hypothetical protein
MHPTDVLRLSDRFAVQIGVQRLNRRAIKRLVRAGRGAFGIDPSGTIDPHEWAEGRVYRGSFTPAGADISAASARELPLESAVKRKAAQSEKVR